MNKLLAMAPPIVAFWGWACLATGAAERGLVVWLGLVGYAASIAARRAPIVAAAVELVAGTALVAHGLERMAFVAVGALLVVSARAITEVVRRAPT
jgi:hypothetical protein